MNELDYDADKRYDEPDEPVVHYDRETGEAYIINPAGTIIYLEGEL